MSHVSMPPCKAHRHHTLHWSRGLLSDTRGDPPRDFGSPTHPPSDPPTHLLDTRRGKGGGGGHRAIFEKKIHPSVCTWSLDWYLDWVVVLLL